jgi:tRNA (guanine-N7-)-methyltransferase
VSGDEPRRFIYGRQRGPKLKPGQRRRLETRLPVLAVSLPAGGERWAPATLLAPGTRRLWLEVGFGAGEHLAWQAAHHPDVTHLGVEPYLNGVAALLARLEAANLANVRICVDDARLVLAALPDASLERLHVLFPDPWPKRRHHKRRIVNADTVRHMARTLAPGGELRLASDDSDYVTWMLAVLRREPRLVWRARRAADWRERPADWPATRYEEKARAEGRIPVFLRFTRRAGDDEENATARA